MINFVVIGALMCPQTVKVLNTDMHWDGCQDLEAYEQAKLRCGELYGKEAPCLKIFTKMEQGVYRAICGAEDKK